MRPSIIDTIYNSCENMHAIKAVFSSCYNYSMPLILEKKSDWQKFKIAPVVVFTHKIC